MDEKEIIKEIIQANATEVYKDSVQPSLRVIGKSLSQCIALFSTPVGRIAEILEKNIHKYLDKLDGLDDDDLVSPDTRILVPILEKMRYIEDENVSDYYAEILATASRKETRGKVMLSFIEILNRVTSDEIKIIEYICANKGGVPTIDINIETQNETGYNAVEKNFNSIATKLSLLFPENIKSYLDNLISLGLLESPYGVYFTNKDRYEELKRNKRIDEINSNISSVQKVTFEEGIIRATDLCIRLVSIKES